MVRALRAARRSVTPAACREKQYRSVDEIPDEKKRRIDWKVKQWQEESIHIKQVEDLKLEAQRSPQCAPIMKAYAECASGEIYSARDVALTSSSKGEESA